MSIETMAPEIEVVWREAQPLLHGESYEVIPVGVGTNECNNVLIVSGPEPSVVKIPHPLLANLGLCDTSALLHREASVVGLLETESMKRDLQPPVAVPRFLGGNFDNPKWAAYSFIPGRVFTPQEMSLRFSEAEFQALGQRLGELIFYFAQAIDLETFSEKIERPYAHAIVDREQQLVRTDDRDVKLLQDKGYPCLVDTLTRLHKEHAALCIASALTPTLVGHDDLRLPNLIFDNANQLVGGIDLAIAKPSSPPREFRHAADMHPAVVRAATETWKSLTGESVDEELVRIWSRIQNVMACVQTVKAGHPVGSVIVTNMQRHYPNYDWQTELFPDDCD